VVRAPSFGLCRLGDSAVSDADPCVGMSALVCGGLNSPSGALTSAMVKCSANFSGAVQTCEALFSIVCCCFSRGSNNCCERIACLQNLLANVSYLFQAFAPLFAENGRIINISSGAGSMNMDKMSQARTHHTHTQIHTYIHTRYESGTHISRGGGRQYAS